MGLDGPQPRVTPLDRSVSTGFSDICFGSVPENHLDSGSGFSANSPSVPANDLPLIDGDKWSTFVAEFSERGQQDLVLRIVDTLVCDLAALDVRLRCGDAPTACEEVKRIELLAQLAGLHRLQNLATQMRRNDRASDAHAINSMLHTGDASVAALLETTVV